MPDKRRLKLDGNIDGVGGLSWLNPGEAQAYEMSCLGAWRWTDGVLDMGFAEPRNGVNENVSTV